jgi:hypothetical protein
MDTSDFYPDLLGDALSDSSHRLAQLASLVTAEGTVEVAARRSGTPRRPPAARRHCRNEKGLPPMSRRTRRARRSSPTRPASPDEGR